MIAGLFPVTWEALQAPWSLKGAQEHPSPPCSGLRDAGLVAEAQQDPRVCLLLLRQTAAPPLKQCTTRAHDGVCSSGAGGAWTGQAASPGDAELRLPAELGTPAPAHRGPWERAWGQAPAASGSRTEGGSGAAAPARGLSADRASTPTWGRGFHGLLQTSPQTALGSTSWRSRASCLQDGWAGLSFKQWRAWGLQWLAELSGSWSQTCWVSGGAQGGESRGQGPPCLVLGDRACAL